MKLIYNVLMLYGLTFVIAFFVAAIIWLLNRVLSGDFFQKTVHRESYQEIKRLKTKKA